MTELRTLTADRVVVAHQEWAPGRIEIDNDTIVSVTDAPRGNASEQSAPGSEHVSGTIIPGFVDIHNHGALGVDFGSAESAEAVRTAAAYHHRRGSTTIIASVATSTLPSMTSAVRTLSETVATGDIAGIHLEGPYLSAVRHGAHRSDLLRLPDLRELDTLIEAGGNDLKMITVAPELPGALALITRLVEYNIVAALGHSDCDADTARAALDAGATVVTHLYNGMRPLHHRNPGLVGVALADERAIVEVILDRFHLAPEAQLIALTAARSRIAAVSDAMQAAGCTDGDYRIADSDVRVVNGAAWLADGSSIAGSTATVSDGFERLRAGLSRRLREAVEVTSSTPARALNLGSRSFTAGEPADFVVLGAGDDHVIRVMRRGSWLTL